MVVEGHWHIVFSSLPAAGYLNIICCLTVLVFNLTGLDFSAKDLISDKELSGNDIRALPVGLIINEVTGLEESDKM